MQEFGKIGSHLAHSLDRYRSTFQGGIPEDLLKTDLDPLQNTHSRHDGGVTAPALFTATARHMGGAPPDYFHVLSGHSDILGNQVSPIEGFHALAQRM